MQTGPRRSIHNETSDSEEVPLVERIAEEILKRQRAGDKPSVEEYCLAYPEHADDLRAFLPALILVEGLKPGSQDGELNHSEPEFPSDLQHDQIGDYRILRELGRGGMGIVYEAEQQSLGRRVALKVLLNRVATDAQAKLRFEREARAAARMHHTNIVPVFEVGSDKDRLFYAMQLILGQSLDLVIDDLRLLRDQRANRIAKITRRDLRQKIAQSLVSGEFPSEQLAPTDCSAIPTSVDTVTAAAGATVSAVLPGNSDICSAEADRPAYYISVARIGQQTADALAYAHARGIIHRDIKPSNLLLDGNGTVWITDFGLAKITDQKLTHTGDILGTLRYMSPERFKGKCDERADVYSLGLTLYELLALSPAFSASDHLLLIEEIAKTSPVSPRVLDAAVPRDLETIVLKSIDKDPRRRYQSAGDLSDDLQRFINDQPIHARRESWSERLVRWARHNRTLAGSMLAFATLLVAATIVSLVAATYYYDLQSQANRTAREKTDLAQQKSILAEEMKGLAETTQRALDIKGNYLYVAHMQMVQQAWNQGAFERMRELLDQHLPMPGAKDRRTFEWYYFDRICRDLDAIPVLDYGNIIAHLSVSPSGKLVALAGDDADIQIFDLQSFERQATLTGHKRIVRSLQFSEDDKTLVSIDDARAMRGWRYRDNQYTTVVEQTVERPEQVRLTVDGNRLAVPGNDAIDIYDLSNPESPQTLKLTAMVLTIAWHPDNQRLLASLADGTICEWDVVKRPEVRTVLELRTPVKGILFSEDATQLVTADDQSAKIFLLESSGDFVLQNELAISSGAFSHLIPIKSGFAVRTRNRTSVWRLPEGKKLGQIDVGPDLKVVPSADGRLLATGGNDVSVTVWDSETGKRLRDIKRHRSVVYGLGFDRTGRIVTAGRDRVARVSSSETLDEALTLRGHQGWVWSVDVSPDGKTIASAAADSNVILWDAEAGTELRRLTDHSQSVQFVKYSPDGRLLATASRDATIKLWDAKTLSVIGECRGHTAGVNSLAFSVDGKHLVSGGDDGAVIVWDIATQKPVARHQIDRVQIWAVEFARNGSVVFGGTTQRIETWDYASETPPVPLYECAANITSLKFSGDASVLAGSVANGTIVLFDYEHKELQGQPTAHSSDAMHVAFSPDDRTLVSCGSDGRLSFRYLDIDEPSIQIDGHLKHVHCVAFSPDGRKVVSGSWDHTVKIWSTEAQSARFGSE